MVLLSEIFSKKTSPQLSKEVSSLSCRVYVSIWGGDMYLGSHLRPWGFWRSLFSCAWLLLCSWPLGVTLGHLPLAFC